MAANPRVIPQRAFSRSETLKDDLMKKMPSKLQNPFNKEEVLPTLEEYIKVVAEHNPSQEVLKELTEVQNSALTTSESFQVKGSLGVPLKFLQPVQDVDPSTKPLSIKKAFDGAHVLITGATGYLGSMVVEQLLRCCPGVQKIYFLARGKKGSQAEARVQKLLRSSLFNLVRDKPELLAKVEMVEGDISLPKLGVPEADFQRVTQATTCIIHSAARIALEDHIQTTLKFNYIGSRNVLDFADCCPNMKAFTHVSSCYVNFDQPHGACVQETLYPLMLQDNAIHHEELASELMNLDPDSSKFKVETLAANWQLPNTYTLGKRLTEQMVAERHVFWQSRAVSGGKKPVGVAIVRPSLVGAIAMKPYAGYVGNWAGPTGFVMAYAMGFFPRNGSAWKSKYMLDTIPGDISSSCIVGATAAVMEGHSSKDTPFIVHAASTTTHPLSHAEIMHMAYKWYSKHPPPFKLGWDSYDPGNVSYEPVAWRVALHRWYLGWMVYIVSTVLKWFKQERTARQLVLGFQQWEDANATKYNKTVSFSARNAIALQTRLVKEEQDDFPMVWTSRRMLWPPFFYSYMCYMHKLLFKYKDIPPSTPDLPHNFVFIPEA